MPAVDVHSFGNPREWRVTHLDLDLTVNFGAKQITGVAILDLLNVQNVGTAGRLLLDTRGLEISAVSTHTRAAGFVPAKFTVGAVDPILGSELEIELPAGTTQVRVAYRTAPGATALQWLEPSSTAGKKQPFLFTQSQAIHARSWIPLQDSPGVRVTYRAVVHVPPGLKAVMAADAVPVRGEAERGVFRFSMDRPIPAYLIALAVGDLAFESLGPRTGVWAEPAMLKASAYEFADVEAMVTAVEKRFGPYRWGRYDILVLPPSFPFGGMENPKLTFATPTILAGDRSLVSLIAHELAHSWSGNLVTNATWRDFWLNEGFTTYLERRIIEDLYGADRAGMEVVLGVSDLNEELAERTPADQVLHVDLTGRDPDDGMTRVPYEKGALFLRTLEAKVGRAKFDEFLRGYFDHAAFQSITTADFVAYLKEKLPDAAAGIGLDAWLEKPGVPANALVEHSTRLLKVDEAAKGWVSGALKADQLQTSGWTTQEWLRFLQALPGGLSVVQMKALDDAFHLTERGNAEIAHQWLYMSIKNGYAAANSRLENYLLTIGRRKLVLPLYKALAATPEGLKMARAIYARARAGYHPITIESVDKVLGVVK
jgi:aminopeptidase N